MFLQAITIVLVGFIMGFVYGWKLTLVIIAVSPLLVIAGGLMAKVNVNVYKPIFCTANNHSFLIKGNSLEIWQISLFHSRCL